jgi:hypothetical protein
MFEALAWSGFAGAFLASLEKAKNPGELGQEISWLRVAASFVTSLPAIRGFSAQCNIVHLDRPVRPASVFFLNFADFKGVQAEWLFG